MLLGTLQVLERRCRAGRGVGRRGDRGPDRAVGRRRRVPRSHQARAVRAVARSGARRHIRSSSAGRSRSNRRIHRSIGALSVEDRTAITRSRRSSSRSSAFTGVAAMVPGGLSRPPPARRSRRRTDRARGGRRDRRDHAWLSRRGPPGHLGAHALWLGADLRGGDRDLGRGIARCEIQRLVGPALLTLVFYLWDAFIGSAPARWRDPRWVARLGVLAALGIVVAAWNLLLRA